MADIERQNVVVHEIPDYNTIFNTPGGTSYNYSQNVHPFHQGSPPTVRFDSGVSPLDTSPKPAATDAVGPTAGGVAILPSQPNIATHAQSQPQLQQQEQQQPQSDSGRRRSSLGMILSNVFSNKESSNKDLDLQRTRSVPASTYSTSSGRRKSSRDSSLDLGRRRSSVYLSPDAVKEGTVHKGPYAHISKAQAEHMERLREAERNLGRTTNIDGLPLPEAQADEKRHRRRSSIANVLGLNKKMLAF